MGGVINTDWKQKEYPEQEQEPQYYQPGWGDQEQDLEEEEGRREQEEEQDHPKEWEQDPQESWSRTEDENYPETKEPLAHPQGGEVTSGLSYTFSPILHGPKWFPTKVGD